LKIKKDKAEVASSAKTRFLAAASHDLRQPLHAMSLLLSVLSEYKHSNEQAEIIGKIKKSSVSLENLLESLLDISKLDAGIISINVKPFKIQGLFDVLYNEFNSIAEEKGLNIQFAETSLSLNSDAQIIERILRNLISNAIRYTEKGKVLVGCRRTESSVRLCVCDTGIGINENETELIFEEFQQLDNPGRDRNKGLGLGLSIVKRLTELLAIPLELKTTSGKGSMFSIECPRSLSAQVSQSDMAHFGSYPKLADKKVIIVEDEEEIRQALKLLLNSWGCEVLELTSINDVKQKLLPDHKPNLILADYRLANYETGVNVIAAIHDFYQDKKIPAVIITGDTAPERIKEVKESGFQILHKPVAGGKLRAVLNSILLSK
ncbi:MAG: hybrid sensor histidine kinase/response regulator, partial [Gammaproteobacteria bacterium]|nr:hybrid sensor histidine kinase/response regulator [Gammaproteobacteria bacterium]